MENVNNIKDMEPKSICVSDPRAKSVPESFDEQLEILRKHGNKRDIKNLVGRIIAQHNARISFTPRETPEQILEKKIVQKLEKRSDFSLDVLKQLFTKKIAQLGDKLQTELLNSFGEETKKQDAQTETAQKDIAELKSSIVQLTEIVKAQQATIEALNASKGKADTTDASKPVESKASENVTTSTPVSTTPASNTEVDKMLDSAFGGKTGYKGMAKKSKHNK